MSLGVLCPGQGAQSPAMFALLEGQPDAAPAMSALEAVLAQKFASVAAGDAGALQENIVAQPLLCAYQLAVWSLLRALLPAPRVFAGYSVGELAAYGCADALSVEATIALAAFRAAAMDGACPEPCGMAAVRGLSKRRLEALTTEHGVEIAIVNGPDRFVVGGGSDALARMTASASALGASVTPLPVHVASHTSLMAPATPAFRRRLEDGRIVAPKVPVLAGIDGTPVYQLPRAIDTLSRQISHQIDWAACLQGLSETGCSVLLELGPGSDLARMAREHLPEIPARSVAEFQSLLGVAEWVRRNLDR